MLGGVLLYTLARARSTILGDGTKGMAGIGVPIWEDAMQVADIILSLYKVIRYVGM
jgi:hypothetical protein